MDDGGDKKSDDSDGRGGDEHAGQESGEREKERRGEVDCESRSEDGRTTVPLLAMVLTAVIAFGLLLGFLTFF